MPAPALEASYVLPLRWLDDGPLEELTAYLRGLAGEVEVLVVDGSPEARFRDHAARWSGFCRHLRPDPALRVANGKVGGVLTGVRLAGHEAVVVADDDVRYDTGTLRRVVAALAGADLVMPQNYFVPRPWHARWDTARILLNRATGGDFSGTVAVRRQALLAAGGYDGDVLFENLELVRTVEAAGGVVRVDPGCLVARRPPTTGRFLAQRVRQAYDELARPGRMVASLALLPGSAVLVRRRRVAPLAAAAGLAVVVAETGRRRAGGRGVFPASASLLAPAWLAERAVCSWAALALRLLGGCPYAGTRITVAAHSRRRLRRRRAEGAGPPRWPGERRGGPASGAAPASPA